jgi:hypothetical protein
MVGENIVSLSHTDHTSGIGAVRPLCHDRPYVWSRDLTFALTSFRENFIFSPLSAYSPTPKANKGFLGPPNIDYNLHAKTTTISLTKR